MPNVVLASPPSAAPALRAILSARRYRFEERANQAFLARGPGATVNVYRTGKVLVTGPDAESVARLLQKAGAEIVNPEEDRLDETNPRSGLGPDLLALRKSRAVGFVEARIGTDESGKGDYFGGLAVAGVAILDEEAEARLQRARVRDSKEVPDGSIGKMADAIESTCPFSVVELAPEEYNPAFDRLGSVTKILVEAHTKVILELAKEAPVRRVVVDEFPGARAIARSLGANVPATIEIRPRAEDDLAVAAASILARRRFLAGLAVLSAEAGVDLPKGAGAPVRKAQADLARRYSKAELRRFAKVHFVLR